MRNLNADALAKIAKHYGNEPITIIDISWAGDTITQYADRDIETIDGRILELSNLDAVVNINQASSSQSLSVTLDDTDGKIKELIDQYDLHKRNVSVYQYFEGLDLEDKFLLFKGKVNSPIIWNEGDRTVSFTIISQLESTEIGFSPEEGQFENLPSDLIGEPWPMCFGLVNRSRTVRLTDRLRGTTAEGIGFPDGNLPYMIAALNEIGYAQSFYFVADIVNTFYQQRDHYKAILTGQIATRRDAIKIFGGESFPRGEITLKVGEALLYGRFNGDTFHFTGEGSNSCYGKIRPHAESSKVCATGFNAWGGAPGCIKLYSGTVLGELCGYHYVNPGTEVRLYVAEPQQYVVSIVPGTVLKVTAWVQRDGQRFLQDVPSDMYTVKNMTFGSINAVIVELHDALSKHKTIGWEDDIFVTFQSDVGPNTVDILEYLIDLYTDFTCDSTSFDHVKSRVEKYPSDFAIYDRKNILNVLQEIAWQARCSIYLKNGIFYLQYLPEEQTSITTITKNDILHNTLELLHTDTEDLVTKMICNWTASGMQTDPSRTVLRHNIGRYGTQEEDYDYYIYDFVDGIIKSASFWLIRYANTWKRVRFHTPLTKLNVETLDYITLDIPEIANEPILVKVEKADYDSNSHSLVFECWCPVKAGTMVAYKFAYPADQLATWYFPTDEEFQVGYQSYGGPNPSAVAPDQGWNKGQQDWAPNVSLKDFDSDPYNYGTPHTPYTTAEQEAGVSDIDRRWTDRGAPKPSDIGDELPITNDIPETPTLIDAAPGPDSNLLPDPKLAEASNADGKPQTPEDMYEETSGEGPGEEEENDPNDLPDPDDVDDSCAITVSVTWLVPVSMVNTGDGSSTVAGVVGKAIGGTVMPGYELLTFKSCQAACAYKERINDMYQNSFEAVVGEPYPYSAGISTAYNTEKATLCHSHCQLGTPAEADAGCDVQESDDPDGMVGYRGSGDTTSRDHLETYEG